jgi:hypothetical protein
VAGSAATKFRRGRVRRFLGRVRTDVLCHLQWTAELASLGDVHDGDSLGADLMNQVSHQKISARVDGYDTGMAGRAEAFLIEPDKWATGDEEVRVDEERLSALLHGPDPTQDDDEMVLALLELLHSEVTQMTEADYGFLSRTQMSLAFEALHATACRLKLAGQAAPPIA